MPVTRIRILLVLFLGIIAVSFASILIRLTPAPALVIAAGRLVFAALLLTPFYLARPLHRRQELRRRKLLLSLLGGVFLAAHFGFWIESLNHTSVASSVVLVAMNPVFVALLSPLLLREKPGARLYIAVGLGALGALIINRPALSSPAGLTGNLLALAGALFAALYVIIGRKLRPGLSLVGYVWPVYLISGVILTTLVLALGYPLADYPGRTWLFILLLALGPQIIGHTSFNWALAYLPAPTVALTILGEPVGTTILAMLLLHQFPTIWEIFGGLLILTAIYIAASSLNTE
ncbi:MAG: DMT family transporter [candidate division WOR-3 bacterium]|uniref:DMT family transporter n=1 Tax=candidate division WOR-3 bacterium TaxID=2052148 RepID=A0A7C1NBJ8_UNCW3|nr:DMT family transporter [candidate division WOR-3 bacterium]